MPTTIVNILEHVELSLAGQVRWGARPDSGGPGVYFVSLSADPAANAGTREKAPISLEAVEEWLGRASGLRLHDHRPTAQELATFLSGFWLPDEGTVYIGKATRLRDRIGQMFRHTLGKSGPHAGGHWLHTLSCVDDLHVYFCESPSVQVAEDMESACLRGFMSGVSEKTRSRLQNPEMPLPFANRRGPDGGRKQDALSRSVAR